MQEIRRENLALLAEHGFVVASSLPCDRGEPRRLRDREEIADRLAAIGAVVMWVSAPEDLVAAQALQAFVARKGLEGAMTASDLEVWRTPRDRAREDYADTVGWRLENMWALAWVLELPFEPEIDGAMIPEEIISEIVTDFIDDLETDFPGVADHLRDEDEVVALEDLFYCAHNAVRSAQLGHATVPPGFDPIANGGVIHERRHGLTWCLSPGVAWDDTDLST